MFSMLRKSITTERGFGFERTALRAVICVLVLAGASVAQEAEHVGLVTPLAELVQEAEQNNPQIQAARQGWKAAQLVPTQVSTLPDPQFALQQVNVGSPRPFAGYTNSDFAYLGLGVSQDLPYPGKLRLKGEIANRDAEVMEQRVEATRRAVISDLQSAYIQLSYLSKTLGILESDQQLVQQMAKAADARYRSGIGNQQDVIQAQLEATKLLREITMHHLDEDKLQAKIKQLAGRPQFSPDIEPVELPQTPLPYKFDELLARVKTQNPEVVGAQKMVDRQNLQIDLAHKDFYPDFNLQFMWQRTDPTEFRAYYMFTLGVRVPIYRSRKQRPELAQAEAQLSQSRDEYDARSQQAAFELRTEYDTIQRTDELIKIDRDGLLPQARAAFQSGMAAYQNSRQDFQPLLASFRDVLRLDEEYWQSIADREAALAKLEELTGLPLREEGASR